MNTPTTTLRLRPPLRAKIERIAKRTRRSVSAVTQDLLEEALRTRECPGINFADEPAGRVAKIAGTGLGVWEVIRDYLTCGKNIRLVKKGLPDLSDADVQTALFYYARYPREIDEAIAENETLYHERMQLQTSGAPRRP